MMNGRLLEEPGGLHTHTHKHTYTHTQTHNRNKQFDAKMQKVKLD